MPSIKQFSENGPVGVPNRCCTTAGAHIRALTARHPIKPTSPCCPSAWQPNPADPPLIDAEILFRQPGPALCFRPVQAAHAILLHYSQRPRKEDQKAQTATLRRHCSSNDPRFFSHPARPRRVPRQRERQL